MLWSEPVYVPAMRWRQSEYQALLRLNEVVKSCIQPLITIPDVEFDFDSWQPKKTVHEHVYPFVARYKSKWDKHPAWITLHTAIEGEFMDDSRHLFDYIFTGLADYGANAIPALPLSAHPDMIAATERVNALVKSGCAVIVSLENLMTGNAHADILAMAENFRLELSDIDLIIDLKSPNFEPYDQFSRGLISILRQFNDLMKFRQFAIVSTAIPETFSDISIGSDDIPRHDWLFYNNLINEMPVEMRRPIYGDYTIVHPNFEAKDMRMIKPAGKVIYTTGDIWATRKGGSFRDNRNQMHTHCQRIVNDPKFHFRGREFSAGDRYIEECSTMREGPSTLGRWKEVAINHHITVVVDQLSNVSSVP